MTTLLIRKTGSKVKKALTFGGEGGWVVTDGATDLATARTRTTSNRLDIEIGDRRLTAEMPGMYSSSPEKVFTVDDATTGTRVVDGTRVTADDGVPVREKWAVKFASGVQLSWMYKTDPRELGFYDPAGNPLMVVGHHVPLDTSAAGGTFRVLLRMWGAAAKSTEEYAAEFDDSRLASLVPAADRPLLALLGMWLERRWDVKGRGADSGFS